MTVVCLSLCFSFLVASLFLSRVVVSCFFGMKYAKKWRDTKHDDQNEDKTHNNIISICREYYDVHIYQNNTLSQRETKKKWILNICQTIITLTLCMCACAWLWLTTTKLQDTHTHAAKEKERERAWKKWRKAIWISYHRLSWRQKCTKLYSN